LNLQDHLHVIDVKAISKNPGPGNEDLYVGNVIQNILNNPELTFFDSADKIPPWRVDVLPLDSQGEKPRLLVAFTYSHTHGDGMSGPAFHRTLLRSMNRTLQLSPEESESILSVTKPHLPGLPQMPVSLSYLLVPALGHYLPAFVRQLFGLKGSVSGADGDTWTGSETFAGNNDGPTKTAVEVAAIGREIVSAVLQTCRKHDIKLTSTLNEIIACALSRQSPIGMQARSKKMNFVSSTPNNLRKIIGESNETIGVFSSTAYTSHAVRAPADIGSDITLDNEFWVQVNKASKQMAAVSSTIQDQPIGLLRFVSDIKGWVQGQIGGKRDASWELSNLMSFQSGSADDKIVVEKMYYSQPADATGPPLAFNIISVHDGDLVVCVSWQPGALGVCALEEAEIIERKFVRNLIEDMQAYFAKMAEV